MNKLILTLEERLHKGIVSFVYLKKDGSRRKANGTLYGVGHTLKGNGTKSCKWTLNYYDMDCQGWRSFLIENLISVGEVRKKTEDEHHEVCIALIVKLKEKMKKEGITAFAYRKKDGSISYTHGVLSDGIDEEKKKFTYYDTDKRKEITFEIDDFVGIGQFGELEMYSTTYYHINSKEKFESLDISEINLKNIIESKGYKMEDVEQVKIIDLLPYLNKEQLKKLIIRAADRMAEL